jgi:hypothetical protein
VLAQYVPRRHPTVDVDRGMSSRVDILAVVRVLAATLLAATRAGGWASTCW